MPTKNPKHWYQHLGGLFQGIPPTGKHLELRWLDIVRIEDGKNAEEWLSMDLMEFIQQLEA